MTVFHACASFSSFLVYYPPNFETNTRLTAKLGYATSRTRLCRALSLLGWLHFVLVRCKLGWSKTSLEVRLCYRSHRDWVIVPREFGFLGSIRLLEISSHATSAVQKMEKVNRSSGLAECK